MSTQRPFIDPASGTINRGEVLAEAVPLARLIGLFVSIALIPLAVTYLFAGDSVLGAILTVIAQFVLAVGAGIVLLYIVGRGSVLTSDSPDME